MEPDAGVKVCWLKRQRTHPADLPPQPMSQKPSFSYAISNQPPLTECPSLLLPVHLSLHLPDSLLLSLFFLAPSLNWLLAPIS